MKRAIISVSDKTGIVEFAQSLVGLGWEIVSTGGTSKTLEEAGVKVIGISQVTGFLKSWKVGLKPSIPWFMGEYWPRYSRTLSSIKRTRFPYRHGG